MQILGNIVSWIIAGGIIGYTGWQAFRYAETLVPKQAKQMPTVPIEVVKNNAALSLTNAMHPDTLGIKLEESFQQWAEEQRAKERESEEK